MNPNIVVTWEDGANKKFAGTVLDTVYDQEWHEALFIILDTEGNFHTIGVHRVKKY